MQNIADDDDAYAGDEEEGDGDCDGDDEDDSEDDDHEDAGDDGNWTKGLDKKLDGNFVVRQEKRTLMYQMLQMCM